MKWLGKSDSIIFIISSECLEGRRKYSHFLSEILSGIFIRLIKGKEVSDVRY